MKKTLKKFEISKVFIYLILFIIGLLCFLPLLYVISVSLSSDKALATYGGTLIPREFSLYAYKFIFAKGIRILQCFRNSVFITSMGTLISLIITCAMAYPLSRKYLPGRNIVMKFVFFTMLFNGGLIPFYILIKSIGLNNTIWSVIIPGALNSWNMILIRNFFMEIPVSLEESALIDGANEIVILIKIILPVSKPVLATIGLFYAVAYWNNWFGPLLFLQDIKLWPLMLFLKNIIRSGNPASEIMSLQNQNVPPSETIKMATVVITTMPILLLYPFLQKYFIKGVMVGSIKG